MAYPLGKVLLPALPAVFAGVETRTGIARFGEAKLEFLRPFRPSRDGTPPPDRNSDIFATPDADYVQR